MKIRSLIWIAMLFVAVPAVAQTRQPNFNGIWQAMSPAHYDLEPHAARLGVPAGVGVIVDPADGKIPYKPEALAKRNENLRDRAKLDPYDKCYKPGTPHFVYLPFPFQIIQTPTQITLLSEYVHNTRQMFLTRKSHWPPDSVDLWNGDTVAHFEGDTLVTDVANFNGQAWLDRSGNFASDQLHVTEKFRFVDNDTIQYEATLEDPKTFTRPWTMRLLLYRHKEPKFRILEYECHAYQDGSLKEPVLPKP